MGRGVVVIKESKSIICSWEYLWRWYLFESGGLGDFLESESESLTFDFSTK